MRVFFGAALQGAKRRDERAGVHAALIACIKEAGHDVVTEHTTSRNLEEAIALLEQSIGPLPPPGIARTRFIRDKMVEGVEGDIGAAVFEVSMPSLGTGIELAHAYLRPRLGLKTVPVLALYEKNYWPQNLSTMVRGISPERVPHFELVEYASLEEAKERLRAFLGRAARP